MKGLYWIIRVRLGACCHRRDTIACNESHPRLSAELQRRAFMSPSAAVPIREGFRTVTPYITVPEGAELIEFMKHTFGAEELLRSPSPAGFHAEVRIGDSMLMIGSG